MNDLVTWLPAQFDKDERVAREASRHELGHGWTPTGEHWQWIEPNGDQVLALDPVVDDYLNDAGRADLRSVERYSSPSSRWTLPHFVMSTEETRTVDAMHIARHDPARVLREVEAKRLILAWCVRMDPEPNVGGVLAGEARRITRWLALPYADRDGYREEWRP